MKSFLNRNWLIIILFLVAVSYVLFSCADFLSNQKKLEVNRTAMVDYCTQEGINSSEINVKELCNEIISQKDIKVDFFTMMTDVLLYRMHFINGIAFLLLCIPTIFGLNKIVKSKQIINTTTRESYNRFMKKFLIQAYKYIWLLPTIALILIIICAANSTLDPTYSITFRTSMWRSNIIQSPIIFIILYLVNIILFSFTFINISLLVVRRGFNYFSTVLLSFIVYVVIELFFEVIVNLVICNIILKTSNGNLFNIMNLFTFSDANGTSQLLLFSSTVFLISCIGVFVVYRNKEKFIIDTEKERK